MVDCIRGGETLRKIEEEEEEREEEKEKKMEGRRRGENPRQDLG